MGIARPDPLTAIDVHVSARLRNRVRSLNISAGELERLTSIPAEVLKLYELGIVRIRAIDLFRLTEALGITVSYFFQEMETAPRHKSQR